MSAHRNPPAFPVHPGVDVCGANGPLFHGMSLRDWFAGQALIGFCSCSDGDGDVLMGAADTAKAAYNYADAMLAQRATGESSLGRVEG